MFNTHGNVPGMGCNDRSHCGTMGGVLCARVVFLLHAAAT